MARIIAYPSASQLSGEDCLLGTQKDQGGVNQSNPTKNFPIGNIGRFITDNYAAKRIVSYYQWQIQCFVMIPRCYYAKNYIF